MKRVLSLLFGAAILTVIFTAVAGAAGSVSAATPSLLSFTDPTGDVSAGPDVTKVDVTGDAASGSISVSVTAPGNVPATPDGMARVVSVLLDTDNNAATGSPTGNEYLLHSQDDPSNPTYMWSIARWASSPGYWVQVPSTPTMGFKRDGDVVTWTLNKTDIGGATSFALSAGSALWDTGNNPVAYDRAPDTSTWLYDISGPTRTMSDVDKPLIGKPIMVPARAHAGKRFTVSFRVTSGAAQPKPLTSGKMVSNASIGGKVIRHTESFKGGVARLSFVVPKNTTGKKLKVSVRIKAPSSQEDGVWIDAATGQSGILGITHVGQSSTRVVSFPIR